MEQKLSDTLVKAIDRSNPMMQNLQLASRFNKLIDEGASLEDNHEIEITENGKIEITPAGGKDGMKKVTATVNVSSGGGGEDKLLCYYMSIGNRYCSVVYTDKPATKIYFGDGIIVEEIFPVDDGKHLFMTAKGLQDMPENYVMNLIYEDGSPSADLKGKFVNAAS